MLQVVEPFLHFPIVIVRLNCSDELHFLALFADDAGDFIPRKLGLVRGIQRAERHLVDALEALLQVLLDAAWLLRVTQNLDQVFVGKEEKAREELSLRLEILVQVLLDVF